MFKVKATVIRFAGDEEQFPCHFGYKIGDEIIFDGENFIGRICLQILPLLDKYIPPLFAAGPRYVDPAYYYPFWYSPPNVRDPEAKKSDGLGMKIVRENTVLPRGHAAGYSPPPAFKWPPTDKRNIRTEITGRCDDLRTAVTFKFEAFDLCDKGDAVPYFRKQMVILDHILKHPGVRVDRIRDGLSRKHVEDIYPGLFPVLLEVLMEEMEVMGYLVVLDGKAAVTEKGASRLDEFKAGLSSEEREALDLSDV